MLLRNKSSPTNEQVKEKFYELEMDKLPYETLRNNSPHLDTEEKATLKKRRPLKKDGSYLMNIAVLARIVLHSMDEADKGQFRKDVLDSKCEEE